MSIRIWINGVEMKPAPPEYLDQAPNVLGYGAGFAAYTPEGIRALESQFAWRIMKCRTRRTLLKIRRELKQNPHLHRKLRSNLLLNIRLYIKKAS